MAGKTNISDYRFSIFINNDNAKRSLIEMEKVMQGYEAELKNLVRENKKDSQEYRDKKKILDEHNAKMVEMRKQAGLQALSLKELRSLQAQLNNELARAIPGTAHRQRLEKEFQAVTGRIIELKVGAAQTSMSFSSLANSFNKYFALVTAGAAVFTGMIFSIKNLISAQGDLSDSLADIRKTTGLTQKEVEDLNKSFGKIDTRTSRQDLRQMAVVAGQLGIAKDDIYAFVDSVDKLNVALGDEMKGGAEEVATQMGKLRNVLTDMKSSNISDDMLRIGNAVNELGAAGFATAPVIVDFASRIGGVGLSLGLTSDEVLGLSATLQELNVSTERGGTAVVKILQKMTTDVKTFAGVAGIPMKDFEKLLNTDLFGAFTKVMEGSRKSGQSATELAAIIKDLEVQGAGASEVFAKFGNNTDMLREKVKLAGESLQGTGSVLNEFNEKNETLGAKLDKLQKNFYTLITLPGVTRFFGNMVDQVISLVNWFKDLPLIIEKYKIAIIALTGVTLAWIATKTRSLQLAIWNNLTLKEGILLRIKDQVVLTALIIKEELLTIWKGKGTIATKLAASAQVLWNTTVAASPIGWLIAGITALIAAVAAYDKYNSNAIALDKLKGNMTALLTNANHKLAESYSKIENQLHKLNSLSADEKKNLQEEIDLTIKRTEAELLSYEAKQKAIGKQAAKPTFWQGIQTIVSGPSNQQEKLNFYSQKNQKEAMEPFDEGINKIKEDLKKLKETKSQLLEITNAESIADKIQGKTYEELSEKLSKYQTALRNTVAGSEEYVRIQNKIKDVNKELAKFKTDEGDGTGKGKNKAVTEYEKLNKQIQEYIDLLQQQVTDDPAQAAITAEKIKRLKAEKQKIDDLVKSYTELTKQKPFTDSSKSGMQMPGETMSPIGQGDFPTEIEDKTGTQVWAGKAAGFLNYADTVAQGLTTIDQILSDSEDKQLAKDQKTNDQKKSNLKRQLDAKLITQKQYDQGVAKLDDDLAKKQRKLAHDQAVRQKEISLIQAVINTALGITAALSGTPPASYVMAILTGVLGAIQIGYIASAFVPAAAKGRYNVIGQDDGRSYNDVPYEKSPKTGIYSKPTLFAETGKEIIIDPGTTRNLIMNYPEVINAINMARVPQRAAGNYVETSTGRTPAWTSGRGSEQDYSQMSASIDRLNDLIEKGIIANISYDHLIQEQAKINNINNDVSR